MEINFSRSKDIKIGGKQFGRNKSLIIGEIAQAHDGSLGMAHAFIDAIANAGADAVKFQTHIAAAESTRVEPWRVKFSLQDENRYDYWERMEFKESEWQGLKQHAEERDLIFLSSPFSLEAVELLERLGILAWKIASGEIANFPLLEKLAKTELPILISTGMSELIEVDAAVNFLKKFKTSLAVMQCTSYYPCPPEKIGLNLIGFFRKRYNCAAGLSDHSGTIYPALAAAALGVEVLEVHVTLSREMFGPDVCASVTTSELNQIVEGVRFIESMNSNPVDKNTMSKEFDSQRQIFSKSLVFRCDLSEKTVLQEKHLTLKKPGIGIPAVRLPEILGRRLIKKVKADQLLSETDLEINET